MRPRDLTRAAAVLVLAAPSPAAAGDLTFFPSNSIDTAAITVRTPAGCPAPADGYLAVVHGHGFPADGQIVTAPTAAGMSRTEGFDVYFAQTMKDFATDNRTTLKGRYDVAVYCVDSFVGTKFATFTGTLTFSTPTKYRASGANTGSVRPTAPAATQPATGTAPPSAPPATGTTPASAPPAGPTPPGTDATPVAAVAATGDGPPIGWIVAGVAAVLLAFEAGRRLGRRSTR